MRNNLERPEIFDAIIKGKFRTAVDRVVGAAAVTPVSLTSLVTLVESTGSDVLTLTDGEEGQIKIFIHSVDGGSVAITPTNFAGASSTSITMVTAGDCVGLLFTGGSWWLLWSTANVEGTPLVIA